MRSKITAGCLTLVGIVVIAATIWGAMTFATCRLGVASSYWLVPVFGGLGGMVGGIIRSDNRLELCSFESSTKVNLGVIGHISVGLGGSSALMFLFGSLLNFDPHKAESFVLIASVSFVAGAFGRDIVEAAGNKMRKLAAEEARKTAQSLVGESAAIAFTQAARDTINHGDPERPCKFYKKLLQVIRILPAPMLNRAVLLSA